MRVMSVMPSIQHVCVTWNIGTKKKKLTPFNLVGINGLQ